MRCSTFGAALGALAFGSANALDKSCDSNVLVKAYTGLNVNTQLVSCMTKKIFGAALDGSVDLKSVNADTAPQQVKTICASKECNTILVALVGSANFKLTDCIVGNNLVLQAEISALHATCMALSATATPTTAAPTEVPAATPDAQTGGDNTQQQNAPEVTPAGTPGAPPAGTPGTIPGAPPADTPGAPPADTPGAPPADTPGAPPADTPGAPPADTPGATPGALPVVTTGDTNQQQNEVLPEVPAIAPVFPAPAIAPVPASATPTGVLPAAMPAPTGATATTTDAPTAVTTGEKPQEHYESISVLKPDNVVTDGVSGDKHCE